MSRPAQVAAEAEAAPSGAADEARCIFLPLLLTQRRGSETLIMRLPSSRPRRVAGDCGKPQVGGSCAREKPDLADFDCVCM